MMLHHDVTSPIINSEEIPVVLPANCPLRRVFLLGSLSGGIVYREARVFGVSEALLPYTILSSICSCINFMGSVQS